MKRSTLKDSNYQIHLHLEQHLSAICTHVRRRPQHEGLGEFTDNSRPQRVQSAAAKKLRMWLGVGGLNQFVLDISARSGGGNSHAVRSDEESRALFVSTQRHYDAFEPNPNCCISSAALSSRSFLCSAVGTSSTPACLILLQKLLLYLPSSPNPFLFPCVLYCPFLPALFCLSDRSL
ncbi:hypothetical protein MHYP_G00230730 [Metynnis hypsauchen]